MAPSTTDPVEFDPNDRDNLLDPYPVYRRLREEAPLYYNATQDFYAVSRFEDVSGVLNDHETYSSAKGAVLELIRADLEYPSGVLIFEDPPLHSGHRRILSRVFTPKLIAGLEPQIRDFCVRALDPLVGEPEFDVIAGLGAQVPMRAIGMLLGIPESEQETVRDMVDESIRGRAEGRRLPSDSLLLNGAAMAEYVEWRAQNPADDVISLLLRSDFVEPDGSTRKLSREEVVAYVTVLAGAGNETTGRLIGWATKMLGDHPHVREELAADPSLIPGAVEEILRLEPPGPTVARYVTRDVEVLGTTVPAGSVMLAIVASANRDDRRYENPDAFDVRRTVSHLTFGGGIHYCLGNALARLEGRIVLEEMLKRFPTWEVDLANAKLGSTTTVRGWETLPVRVP